MFREIEDRIWLWDLDRQMKKHGKEANRVLEEAREKKDEHIYAEWCRTVGIRQSREIEWARNKFLSNNLLREARKLHLPTPRLADEGKWDEWGRDVPPIVPYLEFEKEIGHPNTLTLEAMTELRTAIRNERRARRETIEWRVKIIGGLIAIVTGLVGALIGLISVWKHR